MSDISTDKDEEKKGGALPSWMTGSAKVGSGLGSGGAGGAGGGLTRVLALLTAPKAIVAATVLGGLAIGMGIVNTIQPPAEPSLAQRFNKERASSLSASADLPGMEKPGASALSLAQKANSGFYQDPAAAPAPGGPEKDGAPSVDAPADPAAKAGVKGAEAGAQTPEQMAAALGGQQNSKAGLGNRFGKLSAGLGRAGSGLSGGAGMAGGIGGSFKQPGLTNSRAGDLRGFAGGNKASVAARKLSATNPGKSALRGASAQRLDKMNRAMGNIGTSNADAAAAGHAQQWDAATPTGSGITGAGANGVAGGGQFSGEEGTGGGGPLDNPSSGGTSAAPVKDVGNTGNQTPYQNQLMMAQGMLMLAAAIIAIVGVICFTRNAALASPEPFSKVVAAALTVTMKIFIGIAIGLAVAAAAIGATVGSKYGQGQQGAIIATGGAITATTGIAALLIPQMPAWLLVLGGIMGMAMPLMASSGDSGKLRDRSDIDANGTASPDPHNHHIGAHTGSANPNFDGRR